MVLVDLSPNTVSPQEWIMTGLLSVSAGIHVFLDTTLVYGASGSQSQYCFSPRVDNDWFTLCFSWHTYAS